MARYSVAGILFCTYLAGSALLVRNRGIAYRESLAEKRKSSASASAPAGQSAEAETAAVGNASPSRAQERQTSPAEKTALTKEASSAAQAAHQSNPPSGRDAKDGTLSSKSSSPSRTNPPADGGRTSTSTPIPVGALAAGVARWQSDPLWDPADLIKKRDVNHFTTRDEKELGEQLNGLILRLNPEDRGSGLRRVKEAAAAILERVSRKDINYQFFVLNSDVVNAFSHPGGYVYVSRKLLDMIPEDEEHVLEFVLGHEIAHIELCHALACLRDPGVQSFSDGILQKLYLLIIPHGYLAKHEYAADAWVYQRMKELDRSEHDCLKFLRMLDGYARAHGFEDGRGKPEDLLKEQRGDKEGIRGISPVDNHLRAHPAAYERLKHLKAITEQASAARK